MFGGSWRSDQPVSETLRQVLWWLIAGTKGGITRGRILLALRNRPMNAKQLADLLGIDYKSIRRHLDLLRDNRLVTSMGEKYGVVYFLSPGLEQNFQLFLDIWKSVYEPASGFNRSSSEVGH